MICEHKTNLQSEFKQQSLEHFLLLAGKSCTYHTFKCTLDKLTFRYVGALVELYLSDLHAHIAKLLQPFASGLPLLMARGPVKGSENVRAIDQIHSAHIQEDL